MENIRGCLFFEFFSGYRTKYQTENYTIRQSTEVQLNCHLGSDIFAIAKIY